MDRYSKLYTGGGDQNHLPKKEMQESKVVSQEALQIADKREAKGKENRKIHLTEFRVLENNKELLIAFLSEQCKEIEENIGWERQDLFKKTGDTK